MRIVGAIILAVVVLQTQAFAMRDFLGYRATCAPELQMMRVETMIIANYPGATEDLKTTGEKYGYFGIGEEFSCALEQGRFVFKRSAEESKDRTEGKSFVILERDGKKVFRFPYLGRDEEIVNHVFDVNRYLATYCVYDGKTMSSCAESWLMQPAADGLQIKN